MRRSWILAAALFIVALPVPARAADASITASANAIGFSPNDVTVNVGDTVTVSKAAGSFSHNVHYNDEVNACPGPPTTSSWSCQRTFAALGQFTFHCDLHTSMTATVHVVTPSVAYTWAGATGDLWTDATKWTSVPNSPGTTPDGPEDSVVIDTASRPALNTDLTTGSLVLSGGGGREGTGTLHVAGGNVPWGDADLASGVTILDHGAKVTIDTGSTVSIDGGLHNFGTLVNAGTISGAGSFLQDATGQLTEKITSAAVFGQVSGATANIGGALVIDAAGYVPAPGDMFAIVTSGTPLTGTFSTATGSNLFDVTYNATDVTLVARCLVPNVRRQRLARARVLLSGAGCTVGTIRRRFSSVAAGRVLRQTPVPGTNLAAASPVDLVVSRGPSRR